MVNVEWYQLIKISLQASCLYQRFDTNVSFSVGKYETFNNVSPQEICNEFNTDNIWP